MKLEPERMRDTIPHISERIEAAELKALHAEASGILEETTGKQRYREHKAVDIFDILSQSVE